jgi:hypothetical protein
VKSTDTIVEQWLRRIVESYPPQTAQFLLQQEDPFRNPVGHNFREALTILIEEILGNMNSARVDPAIETIVRIRAVQDFTAAEAVRFIFLLKEVLAGTETHAPAIEKKIDEVALLAFDAYMRCREHIAEIRGREAWRTPRGAGDCGVAGS